MIANVGSLGSSRTLPSISFFESYLRVGLRSLPAELGLVCQVEGESHKVLATMQSKMGSNMDMELSGLHAKIEAVCRQVMDTAAIVSSASGATLPALIATPVWVNGKVFAVLIFAARQLAATTEDQELLKLLARGIGREVERIRLEGFNEQTRRVMQDSIDLFENAFNHAFIGMALVAPNGRMLRVNRALCDLVGYSKKELLSTDFQSITHPEDLDKDLEHLNEVLQGRRNSYRMEKRYFHRNGDVVWALLSVSVIRSEDRGVRFLIAQVQDITEQKRALAEVENREDELRLANQRLEELATRDSLTGLQNRRAFDRRLEELWVQSARSGAPVSLLMLDLDHFKSYNDDYGHPAGDRALTRIAEVLHSCCRASDLAARYGGEEFAIILPDTDVVGCVALAERVRKSVENIADLRRNVTVSIGCATAFGPGREVLAGKSALVELADVATYRAKAAGRNCVIQADEPHKP
ncbi:diguanylate cyclase [Proteobacteria bacterium 005FR1]|nr:diguanylate cyclase [Proteobacteria bacterium 005FR1]